MAGVVTGFNTGSALPTTDGAGTPPVLTVGGRYDLEFAKLATGWRITKRHMKTRYTTGNPDAVAKRR